MSDPAYIAKAIVSSAVSDATAAVQPLLLAAETAVGTGPGADELAALHAELLNQLGIADGLLDTGTMHTDTGGEGK